MIIELCGLPASGKSTTAVFLKDKYFCDLSTDRPLAKSDILISVFNSFLLFLFLLYKMRNDEYCEKKYCLKYFILSRLGELHRAQRECENKLQILDEGPLQALLSVSVTNGVNRRDVSFVLSKTPSDIIIMFDVDESVRKKRIKKRNYKLRPYLSFNKMLNLEKKIKYNYDIMINLAKSDKRVYILHDKRELNSVLHELNEKYT